MFEWLPRRLKPSPTALVDLPFASNEAAFQYACADLQCDIVEGQELAALVVDARQTFGTKAPVVRDDRGIQTATLKVASRDGGFLVLAQTLGPGPDLIVGDLVAWVPGRYLKEFAKVTKDSRFGWMGLITGTIEPRWKDGSWVGKVSFGPAPEAALDGRR